jgi:hypothetical protein
MSSASTSTTVPVCTTCATTDRCCIFTTSACVPTPLHEELTVEELIASDAFAQILSVLCARDFMWNPCSGPFNEGFTFDDLLTELQQTFPDSNWTDADLETLLLAGISRGLFKTRVDDAGVQAYWANQNLLNVNPRNWIYEDVCPRLCAKRQCVKPKTL